MSTPQDALTTGYTMRVIPAGHSLMGRSKQFSYNPASTTISGFYPGTVKRPEGATLLPGNITVFTVTPLGIQSLDLSHKPTVAACPFLYQSKVVPTGDATMDCFLLLGRTRFAGVCLTDTSKLTQSKEGDSNGATILYHGRALLVHNDAMHKTSLVPGQKVWLRLPHPDYQEEHTPCIENQPRDRITFILTAHPPDLAQNDDLKKILQRLYVGIVTRSARYGEVAEVAVGIGSGDQD